MPLSPPLTLQTELGVMSFNTTSIGFVSKSSDIYNMPSLQTAKLLLVKWIVGVGKKKKKVFFQGMPGLFVLATLGVFFATTDNHHF